EAQAISIAKVASEASDADLAKGAEESAKRIAELKDKLKELQADAAAAVKKGDVEKLGGDPTKAYGSIMGGTSARGAMLAAMSGGSNPTVNRLGELVKGVAATNKHLEEIKRKAG